MTERDMDAVVRDSIDRQRAALRIDSELADVRGRLAASTPGGIAHATASDLASRLRGVERALR